LAAALHPGGLKASLRSQKYDVETQMMTFGIQLSGGSIGVAAFFGLIQDMTECAFFDQVGPYP
jgi:hypothetical protein